MGQKKREYGGERVELNKMHTTTSMHHITTIVQIPTREMMILRICYPRYTLESRINIIKREQIEPRHLLQKEQDTSA